jgi:DNA polymerase I-like protein with 3'-5' exonuclease and polymerase domains
MASPLKEQSQPKRICVADLEADGLLPEATRLWCGVFKDIRTGEVWAFEPDDVDKIPAFMDTCHALVMHNGIGYDWPLLRKLYGYEYNGIKVDTLLMSRLQRPHRSAPWGCTKGPHSVEAWGVRLGRHKPEHEDWTQFSPEMLHRCSEDVEIQHQIYRELLAEGKGQDWTRAHKLTFKLFDILERQEQYGWLVDRPYMDQCISTLTRWMDRIDSKVVPFLPLKTIKEKKTKGEYGYVKKPFLKKGGYTKQTLDWMDGTDLDPDTNPVAGPFSRVSFEIIDIGSNQQVKDFLLDEGWIPQKWNTNDAGERTSPKLSHDEPFQGIESGPGRLIARRVQCRHRRSQIEGWIKVIREDGRISQGIGGIASTGRLTHRRIVNVPGGDVFFGKQMRKVFICKPGYKIVGVDSAGCQNRMLAGRVGDPNFTKTLIDGNKQDKTSIHYVNQAAITKVAGITPSYKICKNLNYAFLFGASDNKLASTANVPQDRGAMIRKGLLSVSPGLERLVNELTEEWRSTAKTRIGKWGRKEYYNGYIIGLDGRPVYIESEHCLLVYMLQSDEAILMQYALLFLYKWCKQKGWTHGVEYGFVANVHDEIQAEVRDDIVEEYSILAEQAIVTAGEYLKIDCPHEGEADVGINWYETH